MKNTSDLKIFTVFALALSFFLNTPAPAAADTFVTIGTGGITGVYYPVGVAICRLVNKNRKVYQVRYTVESTGAFVFNVNAVRSRDISMGIVQSDVQYYAANGAEVEQFIKAGPDQNCAYSLPCSQKPSPL
jgi:TRAP transporter TAXI family solute receptor